MKIKLIMITALILLPVVIVSCKKETPDVRDQYVGTWSVHLYFSAIGTEYNYTDIITKSPADPLKILFNEPGTSSGTRIATVNVNSYVYQNFTSSRGISGTYSGEGSINGNTITESGTISLKSVSITGSMSSWYRVLTKQ